MKHGMKRYRSDQTDVVCFTENNISLHLTIHSVSSIRVIFVYSNRFCRFTERKNISIFSFPGEHRLMIIVVMQRSCSSVSVDTPPLTVIGGPPPSCSSSTHHVPLLQTQLTLLTAPVFPNLLKHN